MEPKVVTEVDDVALQVSLLDQLLKIDGQMQTNKKSIKFTRSMIQNSEVSDTKNSAVFKAFSYLRFQQ